MTNYPFLKYPRAHLPRELSRGGYFSTDDIVAIAGVVIAVVAIAVVAIAVVVIAISIAVVAIGKEGLSGSSLGFDVWRWTPTFPVKDGTFKG